MAIPLQIPAAAFQLFRRFGEIAELPAGYLEGIDYFDGPGCAASPAVRSSEMTAPLAPASGASPVTIEVVRKIIHRPLDAGHDGWTR